MKSTLMIFPWIFLLACSLPAPSAGAAQQARPFLQVDFGARTSPVQDGFVAARASVAQVEGPLVYEFEGYPETIATGTITLTLAAGRNSLASTGRLCARDRGPIPPEGKFNQGDLYRDFISGPSTITLGISGLKPGSLHEVRFYTFDKNRDQTMEIVNHSDGARGPKASVAWKKDQPFTETTANDIHTATLQAKAPSSGTLVFRVTSIGGGNAVINAIALSAVGRRGGRGGGGGGG
ncbi:MAG: hypothetical protein LBK99_19405, partial [Opitutaceae bacterium]|nr:hypothetical protein [Opitutaceae bacterium]